VKPVLSLVEGFVAKIICALWCDYSIVVVEVQPGQKKVTVRNTLRSLIKGGIIEIYGITIQAHDDNSVAGVLCPVRQFPGA
jgi:hypothetical protein